MVFEFLYWFCICICICLCINVVLNFCIEVQHGGGLTPGETEKSIDLHKVSGGFGIAIQVETWEDIEILKCCSECKFFVSMNLKLFSIVSQVQAQTDIVF